MSRLFTFKKQGIIGKAGEELIAANFHLPGPLQKLDYKSPVGDFMLPDGRIMEIKTDTYPLEKTPNFFMERYSNSEKKSPGGPWRSLEHGIDLFVYFYSSSNKYYCFEDLEKLVAATESIIQLQEIKPTKIYNTAWVTTGFKVPRNSLSGLFTIHEVTKDGKK